MQLYRSCKILLKRIFHFKEKVMPWNIKLLVDLWVEVQKFWMILNWKFSLLKWELPSSVLLKDLGVSAWGILFYFTASEEDDGCTVLMFSHSNNRKNNNVMLFLGFIADQREYREHVEMSRKWERQFELLMVVGGVGDVGCGCGCGCGCSDLQDHI